MSSYFEFFVRSGEIKFLIVKVCDWKHELLVTVYFTNKDSMNNEYFKNTSTDVVIFPKKRWNFRRLKSKHKLFTTNQTTYVHILFHVYSSAFDWKASRCIYRSFIQISYTDFNTRFVQFTSFFPHIQFRSSSRWYHPVAVFTIEADREDIGAYSTLMNYLLSAFSVVKINKLRKIVYIRVI